MGFDYITNIQTQEYTLSYAYLYGSNNIVFIKCGAGGSFEGFEGKYLCMAERLYQKYGCTVICSSNPVVLKDSYEADVKAIQYAIDQLSFEESNVYLFGNSEGGAKALRLCKSGFEFKKIILCNMPLMINIHKILDSLSIFSDIGTEITLVYGDQDPSYMYVDMLQGFISQKGLKKAILHRLQDTDHCFTGKIVEFIQLTDLFFA